MLPLLAVLSIIFGLRACARTPIHKVERVRLCPFVSLFSDFDQVILGVKPPQKVGLHPQRVGPRSKTEMERNLAEKTRQRRIATRHTVCQGVQCGMETTLDVDVKPSVVGLSELRVEHARSL